MNLMRILKESDSPEPLANTTSSVVATASMSLDLREVKEKVMQSFIEFVETRKLVVISLNYLCL